MKLRITIVAILVAIAAVGIIGQTAMNSSTTGNASSRLRSSDDVFDGKKIVKSEAEWQKLLTPTEFIVLRKKGTERPYTGALTDNKKAGVYVCAACGLHLFSSKHKFDSGTGWPSFYQVINKKNVDEEVDRSIPDETRTEVNCARCGGHLGHVFDDGPQPTGLRYCINSVSLKFLPAK